MFQSTLGPAPDSRADPLIGGGAAGPVFGGGRPRLPPQGPAAVQGRRKGLDSVGVGIGVAGGSGFGHGCSLGDELADQGRGHGTTSSAGFLEDVLVESSETIVEFCPKCVRRHGIEFLANGCLLLNNRSLDEICQVFGRDYVQSVFERPAMIAVH